VKVGNEHEDVTVLWNQGVQTEVLANRSNIIVKNKRDRTCLLIDVAVPSDRNVIQNEAEKNKNLKYRHSANVGPEVLCYTINHWGHVNCK
jgi:hypothetical protein